MNNPIAQWDAVSAQLPAGQGARLSESVAERLSVSFDNSGFEYAQFVLPQIPDSYNGGGLKVVLQYCSSDTNPAHKAPMEVAIESTPMNDSQTEDYESLGYFDLTGAQTVEPIGSADGLIQEVETSAAFTVNGTLTPDAIAAGQSLRIMLRRTGVGDTLTGDLRIYGVVLYEEITEHEISLPVNSSVATGTAPFTIASTTVCTNLNADLLDGQHESAFALLAGRSGGQTYNGGTASGEHLRLYASAHATQGNTYLHKGNTTYVRGSDAFMVIKDNTFFGDRSCEIWSGGAPRIVFTGASGFGYLQLYDASAVVQITIDGSNGFMAGKVVGVTGSNGQSALIRSLTELTTIATATTTDTTIQLPAGALILGVSARVTTAIPTATLVNSLTGATSGTTFSTGTFSTAATTTNRGTAAGCFYNANAQAVRITLNGTPAANTGRVRVTIHYIEITPPTS